jgi:sodium-dependent dicarboxylate transporter 2/3/5
MIDPFKLGYDANKVFAVAILMISWWITEALPMPAVALIPLVLFPLMGIAKISEAAAPYANEVVFLFMGGFMIGLAIEKWSLHRRIALSIVQFTGTNGNRILLGFILATGFISMWLSNTATTMMMLPIAASVISVVVAKNEHSPQLRYFAVSMMLAIAYASNFGGIATIIGTPPNVAYASFISKQFNYDISFSAWMLIGFPVSMALLFSLYFVLIWMFPSKIDSNEEMRVLIKNELSSLGPMSVPEKRVLVIFLTTATLWITRDLINKLGIVKLDDNMIAVFGAILMFLTPSGKSFHKTERLLGWSDTTKMAWGILLLFGGGMAMAGGLEKVGLINSLGNWMSGFTDGSSALVLIITITIISIMLSEVMSNVAQVIVLAPVVTAMTESLNFNSYNTTFHAFSCTKRCSRNFTNRF